MFEGLLGGVIADGAKVAVHGEDRGSRGRSVCGDGAGASRRGESGHLELGDWTTEPR
jgi:hypothetical protein